MVVAVGSGLGRHRCGMVLMPLLLLSLLLSLCVVVNVVGIFVSFTAAIVVVVVIVVIVVVVAVVKRQTSFKYGLHSYVVPLWLNGRYEAVVDVAAELDFSW